MSKTVYALIDCQNDFIDGALGVGYEQWSKAYDYIEKEFFKDYKEREYVFTFDTHPIDHCSFLDQGGPWPIHCVEGSMGAQPYWKLKNWYLENDVTWSYIQKGMDVDKEEYGIDVLKHYRKEENISEVHIAGLCTDYCVKESAIMTANAHPEVTVFVHLKGSVSISEDTEREAINQMKEVDNIRIV